MGEVYRARDSKLQRIVAVKVLSAELADADARRRFQNEAQLASSLNHPHILTVHDVGDFEGRQYLVTEFVEGGTLRTWAGAEHRTWRQAFELLLGVFDGLAAAHEAGIVHRDVKPENILVGRNGYAKLADFGLAKLFERDDQAVTQLGRGQTQTGAVVGTIRYMSPEQAAGNRVDARSDIFSFGIVLYELFSGCRPFAGVSDLEELQRILHTAPAPLSDVPEPARIIVDKALEKDPANRYQSMRELAIDVRRLTRGASAGAPSTMPRAATLFTKWRYWALAAMAVIIGVVGVYTTRATASRTIDSLVVLPFAVENGADDRVYLAEGISESLTTILSRVHGLRLKSSDAAFAYSGKGIDPEAIGRQLHVRGVLRGRLRVHEGVVSISAELVDTADGYVRWKEQYNRPTSDMLALAEQISREISENLRGTLTGDDVREVARRETHSTDAYDLYQRGRYEWNRRNEEALKRSVTFFQQAIDADPAYALAWEGLADSYVMLAAYGVLPSQEAYPRAKAAAARALTLDGRLAGPHASIARVDSEYEWDWAAAEQEYKRAILLDSNYPIAHHWYAIHLAAVGRTAEALVESRRAVDADPLSLIINAQGAWMPYFARDYESAARECQRVIAMDPSFAWGHSGLGSVYLQQRRFEQGVRELEESVKLSKQGLLERAYLGHAYAVAGRTLDARTIVKEFQRLGTERPVPPQYIALIYAGLGELDDAFTWLDRAATERSMQAWLLPDPRWDPLRGDARFKAMLVRLHLGS